MREQGLRGVVVAYGGADQLDICLAALEQVIPVIVIDNSSSTDVASIALRREAAYCDPGSNLGFATAVNVALRRLKSASPEAVLLLNPDAVVTPDALQLLVDFLADPRNADVAAVSPRLVGLDGAPQRVVWPFPSPWRACAEAAGLGRLPARSTFVIGAVLMLRWSAICEVGFFDERFFLYAEETDWQRRALALGWRSSVCESAVAVHGGGGASESPIRRDVLFHAAHEAYVRKWYGSWAWWRYRIAAFLGAVVRGVVLRGERGSEARRRASLYARGPRRCAAQAQDR